MRLMSKFEKWQVGIGIGQSVILFSTFIAALFIGIKQNQINQNLLDLQFNVSIEITYDHAQQHFNIHNKGQNNIWLWGSKLNGAEVALEKEPRQITPGGFYYVITDKFEPEILSKLGQNGEKNVSFDVLVETQNREKWTVHTLLFIQVVEGNIKIHTQTVSVMKNWLK